MRITINPVLDMETLQFVANSGVYVYDGPCAEFKKGRETMAQNAQIGQNQAIADNAASKQANDRAQSALQLDLGQTTPGQLTPAATAQLASDRDNIGRVYNGMRQTAFASMGQRGFGNAPSGFSTAAQNGLNVGQEGAETGAYRNAQVQTQNQRNFATNAELGSAATQGNLGAANLGQSTNSAVALNHAGSTAGDILGGVASVAPIIAAPFTGGASLAAMAGLQAGQKLWGNLGKNTGVSGIGSYNGQSGGGNAPGYG